MTGVNSLKSPNFFTHPGGVNWSIFRQNFFWFNLLFVRVYNSLPQASLPLRQVLKSPWFMKGVLNISVKNTIFGTKNSNILKKALCKFIRVST